MKLGILNSGGYNLNSIRFACNRIGLTDIRIINSNAEFETCDKIIIPGVGHAKNAMNLLNSKNLTECVLNTNKPVLGICLGMQIMCQFSEEGSIECIGIFEEDVLALPKHCISPQMGWNKMTNGKYQTEYVYFANSYYLPKSQYTQSYVDYENIQMSAIIQKNNFIGCQFHPEKSGIIGEKILTDFIYDRF